MRRKSEGFTILEILIVLAIVGVIAALLLPALSMAREKSRSSSCQSNLRQIQLACSQYVQDNDGAWPFWYNNREPGFPLPGGGGRGWAETLQVYLKSTEVLQCPTEPNGASPLSLEGKRDTVGYTDYAYNLNLSGIKSSRLTGPSNTVVNCDCRSSPGWNYARGPCPVLPGGFLGGTLHSGGSNYSFADGHTKWLHPSVVRTGVESSSLSICDPLGKNATFCAR